MTTTTKRPTHGRLVFVESVTNRTVTISVATWPLLQLKKKQLAADPQFRNGHLKITHL
jgi:hypothetical protein